jgi:carbamoyltransferase
MSKIGFDRENQLTMEYSMQSVNHASIEHYDEMAAFDHPQMSRWLDMGLYKPHEPIRLQLGCGEQPMKGFINLDYPPDNHSVMQCKADDFIDIKVLDLPENCIDEIRLHHVFEHFGRVTAIGLLVRWYRWLKIGGRIVIETPDMHNVAKTICSDVDWQTKMAHLRHISGDQTDSWGFHLEPWFEERFQRTLAHLGYANVSTHVDTWSHYPFLSNVTATGSKNEYISDEQLLVNAKQILWQSIVAPAEKPSFEIWCRQLEQYVKHGIPPHNQTDNNNTSLRCENKKVTKNNSACIDTIYIGLKLHGHDSSAFSIFPEQKNIFGMATERITRYKHDTLYPIPAIEKMIDYQHIAKNNIRRIHAASGFTCQKEEVIDSLTYEIQVGLRNFLGTKTIKNFEVAQEKFFSLSKEKQFEALQSRDEGKALIQLFSHKRIMESLDENYKKRLKNIFPNAEVTIDYYDHELCHAIAAYFSSPFDKALIISFDAFGDDNYFSKIYFAEDGKMTEIGACRAPKRHLSLGTVDHPLAFECSIGGIYSYITHCLGFRPDSDEGKVEALAAYGKQKIPFFEELLELVHINFRDGIVIDTLKAEQLLNKKRMDILVGEYKREDIASAVQEFLETVLIQYIGMFTKITGEKNICLVGGVAANVIANMKIYDELCENIHIVPAMSDDGCAQGAAILSLIHKGHSYDELKWLKKHEMPYWGTSYTAKEVTEILKKYRDIVIWQEIGDHWPEKVAKMITEGKVGAIFHGRMEWGPRALGNRSIVADARNPEITKILNLNIKKRPEFQPFYPSILEEDRERLFRKSYQNKHMTIAFKMKQEYWDQLPGAIHVDGTARAQFVTAKDNPLYYRMLKEIKEITGFGVVINTSFNKHGRTIVESPEDAINDYLDTSIDFLMIEGLLIQRKK